VRGYDWFVGIDNLVVIIEPVAKPEVLQFAGGAKLRPTEDRLVRRGIKAANAALELSPYLAGLMTSA
jgi:hypothetical protein